jgi:hypothetical protein
MSPSNKLAAVLAVVALAIVAIIGGYDYGVSSSSSSMLRSEGEQTISSLQSKVSYLESHPVTSVTTSTAISIVTSIVTTLTAVTFITTQFPNVPWKGDVTFLARSAGVNAFLTFGSLSSALLFDCTTAATTGCSVQQYDVTTGTNASIVTWYPVVNQTGEPGWANCFFELFEEPSHQPLPGYDSRPTYAYCIAIGSTAFVVAAPGPPGPT